MFAAAAVLFALAAAAPPPAPPPTPPPMVIRNPEPILWPGSGTFGIRVGWDGGTGTGGISVGNVGLKYLLNDNFALAFDVGVGISGSRTGSGASFALDGGVLIYLRSAGVALRPYFPLMLGVGIINSSATPSPTTPPDGRLYGYSYFHLAFAGGFGAEFWLHRNFSLAGELLLRLQMSSFDPVVVSFGTIAPGIHATFYF